MDDEKLSGKTTQGGLAGIRQGTKPSTGAPSGPAMGTGIYTPGGNIIGGGDIRQDNAYSRANPTDPNDPNARIGDYVLQPGGAAVVPNSPTDLLNRYMVVRGGTSLQGLNFTDFVNAISAGASAGLGIPTMTNNPVGTVMTGAVGQTFKALPWLAGIWAGANFASSLSSAFQKHLDDWMNQEVDYDVALDFSTDENGNTIAKVNYDKMKDAGIGSGKDVLSATDTENSDVALLDDNNLSVNVSPAFANSDVLADTLNQIKEAYPNLTQEDANRVIDEETGSTVLDTIKQYILSQESQYFYNAKSIYEFKQVAPDASAESLAAATHTQLMGAMDKNTLEKMTVTVYNKNNIAEEVNAAGYLDSIKDMSTKDREEYMLSIGNRIQSSDISDDEKAVLQAQANALYMASNNDGPYKDMYRKGFWDSIMDTRTLILGLRLGNIFGVETLTTFQENELFRGALDLVTTAGRVISTGKLMNKIEELMRKGAINLGAAIGDNKLGNMLQNINQYAPQDVGVKFGDYPLKQWLGKTSVQLGAQFAADTVFDTAKLAAHAVYGEDFDFWDELKTDFLIDALMTYGPRVYTEAMNRPKYEYGRLISEPYYKTETEADISRMLEEDEFFDGKYEGPSGAGIYDVKLVEVTAEELGRRHAKRLAKLADSKIGNWVQENFFDRNAAMAKVALQIYATTGDRYLYQRALRYAGDIRQITEDTVNEYKMRDSAHTAITNLYSKISEIVPKNSDMSKEDQNYINALYNRDRFLEMHKGDKEAEKAIHKEYDRYIDGMDPARAQQLGELVDAMKVVASDAMDFYVERGVLSKKQLKDLRNDPVYKRVGYMPVWTKTGKIIEGDISKGRAKVKSVFDPKVLINVDDLENPLVTIGSFINNVGRNVALNDTAMFWRDILSAPGMGIHILEDTSGALSEVKNLREMSEKYEKQYQKIVKEVKDNVPTLKQWQKANDELILKSKSMQAASKLEALKQEAKDLRNELRRAKRAQDKALKIAEAQKAIDEAERAIAELKKERADYENQKLQLSGVDANFNIAGLSYDERRQLAEDVERYSRSEKGGFGDYIVLYRVQGGEPDRWRPNGHGVKGKFEALGGEKGLKGAVWLTADRDWAEGPERATSGVKDATNENIVVIPVKRSDILPLLQETNAKNELDKSGKKIVQTRGIDGGLKKSEFILWENEHPEIFEDGMNLMLEQYASNQLKKNQRAIRRIEQEIAQIDETIKEFEDGLPKESERWYRRFSSPKDEADERANEALKHIEDFSPEYDFHGAMERMTGAYDISTTGDIIGLPDRPGTIGLKDALPSILNSELGRAAFADDIAKAGGNIRNAAEDIDMRFAEALREDPRVQESIDEADTSIYAKAVDNAADAVFSKAQADAISAWYNKRNAKLLRAQRDTVVDNWHRLQPLINRLGIGGYTYGRDDKFSPMTDEAYGTYSRFGVDNPYYGSTGDTGLTPVRDEDGDLYWVSRNPQNITLSLRMFETLPAMKSTLVHEAAHAAFSKAANRVAILKDALKIIGVKDAKVTDFIANSADATELIAYMTQKKYLSELAKRAEGKEHDEIIDHLNQDEVVQRHLDNILKMIKQPPVNFKKNFIEVIYDAITFVKAKVAGTLSLKDTNTFADFYSGLISGRFASDMRVDTTGSPLTRQAYDGRAEIDFEWWRVPPDAEKLASDIIEVENKITVNKEAQAKAVDDIKNEARVLMEEAAKLNKYNPAKLDIQTYVDVQLTNDLKKAFSSKDPTGEIQAVLNKAVQEANPYVARRVVLDKLTAEAAYDFRKKAARDIKVVENVRGKKRIDKINDLADKVTDAIMEKVTGKKATVTAIDDGELTRILNSNGDPHTIRYMMDGEEHKMVLTGKGSEALVKEFYAPEAKTKTGLRRLATLGNKLAQVKRYLTTSSDVSRVLPNLGRDWSRGIVTTGGTILLDPDQLRSEVIESGRYTPEQVEKINNGFNLAREAVDRSTFTQSMMMPKKNRGKAMVRAANEPDGNAFVRFVYDRTESAGKLMSTLQDMGESFTRRRAMETAYYKTMSECAAKGMSPEESIKRATEAAYFYGREATVNFFRRGKLISEIAQQVPYLSQNFANLKSFEYAFLNDPITVTRSLKATVSAYTALIAIALSNDESRKRYFLLTEYDRANNIIIPLTNDMIVTIPLDETVAAFLTPYRRMVETLNGVDPEAFYLWGAEMLEALSPIDLSGFSEGDKFNVVRGLQKAGSEVTPTWALPILESMTGTDWYTGSSIEVTKDYIGATTGNWDATPGELTTKSKNSEILSHVANATGIPQWILQNIYSEYGGNVGQYFLNMLDKLSGATEEAQGGREFMDAIFKPLTGADSNEAKNAFWRGIDQLDKEKEQLQRELKNINEQLEAVTAEAKAELQNKRQEKIKEYGLRVSDFLNQYLSAFEITGGLTKSQANRVWRLYDIYDQNDNELLYREGSPEERLDRQAGKAANKEATNLAGLSGFDRYYHTPKDDYNRTYAEQMFRNTLYGEATQQMTDLANILEDTSDYNNSFTKLRSDMYEARNKAYAAKDWDLYDKIAYQYDYQILSAIYPYLVEHGVTETLNKSEVMRYLEDWIVVPSEEMRTSKGKYVPNLGVDSEKSKAFKKQFIKKMYGVSGK